MRLDASCTFHSLYQHNMKPLPCPSCASTDTRSAGRWEKEFEPKSAGFAVTYRPQHYVCRQCATVWRAACPRSVAIIHIAVGVAAILLCIIINVAVTKMGAANSAVPVFLIVLGAAAILLGLRLLFSRIGKLEILGKSSDP